MIQRTHRELGSEAVFDRLVRRRTARRRAGEHVPRRSVGERERGRAGLAVRVTVEREHRVAASALQRLLSGSRVVQHDDGRPVVGACHRTGALALVSDQARLHRGARREFVGFNRARHAVLEAAIYVTRLHLLSREFIDSELARLQVIVDKTAGPQEREAMILLTEHVRSVPAGREMNAE